MTLLRNTIKSIIKKYLESNPSFSDRNMLEPKNELEKKMMLTISDFYGIIEQAYNENAPYKICGYIYELSNLFNTFYNTTKILTEDKESAESHIILINLIQKILEKSIDLLGFSAPDKM